MFRKKCLIQRNIRIIKYIPDLNTRNGVGTNTTKTWIYSGIGLFTILRLRKIKILMLDRADLSLEWDGFR